MHACLRARGREAIRLDAGIFFKASISEAFFWTRMTDFMELCPRGDFDDLMRRGGHLDMMKIDGAAARAEWADGGGSAAAEAG